MKTKSLRRSSAATTHERTVRGRPYSSMTWRDRDLMSLGGRSMTVLQDTVSAKPPGFNPGRRCSLQRQDALQSQQSEDEPPPISASPQLAAAAAALNFGSYVADRHPDSPQGVDSAHEDSKRPDLDGLGLATSTNQDLVTLSPEQVPAAQSSTGSGTSQGRQHNCDAPDAPGSFLPELDFHEHDVEKEEEDPDPLMESVLQFVELPNYEPCQVAPLGSYTTSPKSESPGHARRCSLASDIVKLAMQRVSLELDEAKAIPPPSNTDVNQNTQELCNHNDGTPDRQDKSIYRGEIYLSPTHRASSPNNGFSNEVKNKTKLLQGRPRDGPNVIQQRKGSSRGRSRTKTKGSGLVVNEDVLGLDWRTRSHSKLSDPRRARTLSADAMLETTRATPRRLRLNSPNSVPRGPSPEPLLRRSISLSTSQNVSCEIHRSTCYIPGPHSIDMHNAFSVTTGPHSDIRSLLEK